MSFPTDELPDDYFADGDRVFVKSRGPVQEPRASLTDLLNELRLIDIDLASQIAALECFSYKGTWNANTNDPTLASGVGDKGDYYVVSVSGNTDLDGVTDWSVGDWAVFNGTVWEKADHTDVVTAVFGRQGAVVAALNDYAASLVDNDSGVVGATVKAALDTLGTKAPFGVNVEVLTGTKTISDGDPEIQLLDTNAASRTVQLPDPPVKSTIFIIRNMAPYNHTYALDIKQGVLLLDNIYAFQVKYFAWDGTAWRGIGDVTGEFGSASEFNVALGARSKVYDSGVAIGGLSFATGGGIAFGKGADAYSSNGVALGTNSSAATGGTAVGTGADAQIEGVAAGLNSEATNYGVALGGYAEALKDSSVSLGPRSVTTRANEITHALIRLDPTLADAGRVGFLKRTLTPEATPTFREIFLYDGTTERLVIKASSVFSFRGMFTAIDKNFNVAKYEIEGLIKRDGSDNTTLLQSNVTTVYEDIAGWDLQISADDTNESLKVEFKGNDSDTDDYDVRVAGWIEYVEATNLF